MGAHYKRFFCGYAEPAYIKQRKMQVIPDNLKRDILCSFSGSYFYFGLLLKDILNAQELYMQEKTEGKEEPKAQ